MSLGDIFSSIAGRIAREAVQDAAQRGLADHADRRKPGSPPPTSAHCGRVVLTLTSIMTAALCLAFAWLVLDPSALKDDDRPVWLVISGGLALMALLALWDAFARRIDWNETTVRFRAWNGDRSLPWADIVGVEEKSYPSHIRITFRDGGRFKIHDTMHGSGYFMRLIEGQLTPQSPDGSKRRRRRQHGKKR
jgi:hypothetical protein